VPDGYVRLLPVGEEPDGQFHGEPGQKRKERKEAKRIVIQSIQRVATETAIENSVTVFHIESDEIFGSYPLDRLDNDSFGFLAGSQFRIIHDVIDE